MALYCTVCKTKLRGKPSFCASCGIELIYPANPPKIKDFDQPTFFCANCEQQLDGQYDDCPKCGNKLSDGTQEQAVDSNPSAKGTKKCPFCAENIKIDAVICKHCGRDYITPEQLAHIQKESQKINKLTAWGEMLGSLGCIMMALPFIGILLVISFIVLGSTCSP